MRKPSTSIAQSLRGQSPPGRRAVVPVVEGLKPSSGISAVPGEGGAVPSPGAVRGNSAQHFATVLGRRFGGRE